MDKLLLEDLLLKTDMQKDYLENIKGIISRSTTIYAWGTGRGARKLLQLMKQINWNGYLCFIDSNKSKVGISFEGFNTISPSDYFSKYYQQSDMLLITCADVDGVKKTVKEHISEVVPVVCDLTSIDLEENNSWFDFIWEHISEFSEAYELLQEKKSREIYVGLLNYRISRDQKYIEKFVDDVEFQYFEKKLFNVEGLIIADCGAYVGDTIENYIRITNGNYRKIYTFEPDKAIYLKLINNIQSHKWSNIEAYNIGNYSKKAQLRFESPGTGTEMSNHLTENGNVIVDVDSLDNVIKDDIGLIKMDIEGAEYEALLGCKRLINEYHPVLAICIYHLRDDYFRLLGLIHELYSDYKLYIRQYAYNDNETIVYAVP